MHVFGLTGGIASGKSTVARHFRSRGLAVVDADELAREAVVPGTTVLSQIVDAFGTAILRADGSLDRSALAGVVFGDPAALRRLNAIVHPDIAQRARRRFAELEAAGEPLASYEAALLVENGDADRFRPLVVVACDEGLQRERLRLRGYGESDTNARIEAQTPLAEKVRLADWVIDTSRTLEETYRRSDEVLRLICEPLAVDPVRYLP